MQQALDALVADGTLPTDTTTSVTLANTKDRAEIWVCSVGVSPARDRRDA